MVLRAATESLPNPVCSDPAVVYQPSESEERLVKLVWRWPLKCIIGSLVDFFDKEMVAKAMYRSNSKRY